MVSKHENISRNQFRYFGVISGGFFFICTKFTISYVHYNKTSETMSDRTT